MELLLTASMVLHMLCVGKGERRERTKDQGAHPPGFDILSERQQEQETPNATPAAA